MAFSYPINHPTTIGFESITLRAVDASVSTKSPFSMQQQTLHWGGQQWEADVTIPQVRREISAEWKAFLLSLKGNVGTFLMGDPDYSVPQGSARSGNANGTKGNSYVTFDNLNGDLYPGDYFQLGVGSTARLYQVLEYVNGTGQVEVWPDMRDDYSNATVVLEDPKGLFRLTSGTRQYSINNNNQYAISFSAEEAL